MPNLLVILLERYLGASSNTSLVSLKKIWKNGQNWLIIWGIVVFSRFFLDRIELGRKFNEPKCWLGKKYKLADFFFDKITIFGGPKQARELRSFWTKQHSAQFFRLFWVFSSNCQNPSFGPFKFDQKKYSHYPILLHDNKMEYTFVLAI
jgi:hypothetical protein